MNSSFITSMPGPGVCMCVGEGNLHPHTYIHQDHRLLFMVCGCGAGGTNYGSRLRCHFHIYVLLTIKKELACAFLADFTVSLGSQQFKLEMMFMKHYTPNPLLVKN